MQALLILNVYYTSINTCDPFYENLPKHAGFILTLWVIFVNIGKKMFWSKSNKCKSYPTFDKVSKTNSSYFEEILAFKHRVFGKSNIRAGNIAI